MKFSNLRSGISVDYFFEKLYGGVGDRHTKNDLVKKAKGQGEIVDASTNERSCPMISPSIESQRPPGPFSAGEELCSPFAKIVCWDFFHADGSSNEAMRTATPSDSKLSPTVEGEHGTESKQRKSSDETIFGDPSNVREEWRLKKWVRATYTEVNSN